MLISEAKDFIGQIVQVTFTDRSGNEISDQAEVFEVNFVPFYGPCMVTDIGEIRLDRVVSCELSLRQRAV
jgi:hypothetical protein